MSDDEEEAEAKEEKEGEVEEVTAEDEAKEKKVGPCAAVNLHVMCTAGLCRDSHATCM